MLSLIFTFFRYKIRFWLSFIIFIILFLFFSLILVNYSKTNLKIQDVENKETNRELMVEIRNKDILANISEIEYIETVDIEDVDNNSFFVTIFVDIEKHVDYVEARLKELELNPYLVNHSSVSELESYKTTEFFLKIFTIIFVILFVIIIYIEVKLLFLWDNKNTIMLKVLGYHNNTIYHITMAKIYLLLLLASITSSIFLLIINPLFKINISILLILLPIIIAFIISFLQTPILISKIKKATITQINDI